MNTCIPTDHRLKNKLMERFPLIWGMTDGHSGRKWGINITYLLLKNDISTYNLIIFF